MATLRGLAGALPDLAVLAREDHGPQVASPDPEDREVDAVLDGEPVEEPGLLVGAREAEPRPLARRDLRDVPAEHLDRPARRGKVAEMTLKKRRLPRAVRPEDRSPLAGRDVEVDVVDGEEPTEPPADPPQAEGRLGVLDGWCCFGHRPT